MSGTKEIIKAVAEKTGLSQVKTREIYDALVEVVTEQVKTLEVGESLTLLNLATFKVVRVEDRNCRNPKTGESFVKPAHNKIKAVPAKPIKDLAQ